MGDNGIVVLGIIVIVLIGLFAWVQGVNEKALSSESIEPTIVMQGDDIDLSEVFMPYVASSDIQATCALFGGTFENNKDAVGCFNSLIAIDASICSSPVVVSAMAQCRAVGGTAICDRNNVGCRGGV